MRIICN